MKKFIYADNAATTQLDNEAFEAMKPWLLHEYGNASQPYSFARKPKQALTEARKCIADCIGASPEEIFFTSCGTESDNWVIKDSIYNNPHHNNIITSAFEHHAILNACSSIEKVGYPVTYLLPTSNGYITPEALEHCITDSTHLVSVMFANNELGTIQPIQELSDISHRHGALFHTDAVQAVGHVPLNVHELGVDFLSASAHKFNGPKGIGFLYKKSGIDIFPYIDGGAQENHLRAGTENIASIVGMAIALRNNCNSLADNMQHVSSLERHLIDRLNSYQISFHRNGEGNHLPGIINISFPNKSGEAILHRMDLMGISISTGSACDSTNTQVSHVLQSIKLNESLAKGTIRISIGKSNSLDEIDIIADSLIRIVGNN